MKKLFLVAALSCAVGVISTASILKYQYDRAIPFLFIMEKESDISMMATYLRLVDKGDQQALRSTMIASLGCLFYMHDQRVFESGFKGSSLVKAVKQEFPEAVDDPLCGDEPIEEV